MLKRNKTFCLVLLICSMMFVITGCGNKIPEMTEEETAPITEYAAGLLLQYHADYEGRLVDTSIPPENEGTITEEDQAGEADTEDAIEEAVSENSTSDSETVSDNSASSGEGEVEEPQISVSQVLGVEGLNITCGGYEVTDSYPSSDDEMSEENMLFAMRAGAGNKLLVVKINISNPTGSDIVLNTISMTDMKCKILINGNKKQNAYVSMLDHDFMMLDRTIVSGESMEAVVVTEMPSEDAAQIAAVSLTVQREGQVATVDAVQ